MATLLEFRTTRSDVENIINWEFNSCFTNTKNALIEMKEKAKVNAWHLIVTGEMSLIKGQGIGVVLKNVCFFNYLTFIFRETRLLKLSKLAKCYFKEFENETIQERDNIADLLVFQ